MKYKVGDRVKIRDDLEVGKSQDGVCFVSGMIKFKGKNLIINEVIDWCGTSIYSTKGNNWYWTNEMFERLNIKEKLELTISISNVDYEYQKVVKIKPIKNIVQMSGETRILNMYVLYVNH